MTREDMRALIIKKAALADGFLERSGVGFLKIYGRTIALQESNEPES